ncbi:MAG TPA: helix-turn-helix domain-containing protein [Pseudonocardia sp.]|jgi:AcrR family transcriptional regulator|nr:helix-turn-helix domain-containing protein [Pseudonocardia sp.]
MVEQRTGRRRRADGEQSRRRILDAAAQIAGERGYDGTSIAAVSAHSGLPASSIYWYFANKDELIAAVIERSFGSWLSALTLPDEQGGDADERVRAMAATVAKTLLDSPDFLRLGLMLALERRPSEATARTKFLEVREIARQRVQEALTTLAPSLPEASVRQLSTYVIAGADGLFIAHEIDGDTLDLIAMFQLHARAVVDAVTRELAAIDADPHGRKP